MLAASLGVAITLTAMAVGAPGTLAALVAPVIRVIESVTVGDHTQIVRRAERASSDVREVVRKARELVATGDRWHINTPYGGFGGGVPEGASPTVRRVDRLDVLRSSISLPLRLPTHLHRDEPVLFDHAYVAPDGSLLMFFGSGQNELLLSMFPVGDGRSVSYGRVENRWDSEGRMVFESPELKTEEVSLGGRTAVWDPDPWTPGLGRAEGSALRWEEGSVSYSLMGRSLAREEAEDFFLSLPPLDAE